MGGGEDGENEGRGDWEYEEIGKTEDGKTSEEGEDEGRGGRQEIGTTEERR
jgi:hypothetical protein